MLFFNTKYEIVNALYIQNPVIAVNNGGPCETVQHEVTGFLCEADKNSFSNAMLVVICW